MSKSIVASVADFTKQIADSVAIGDTTFTLNSLTDADGVALADAKLYGFTIDTGAKKEYVVALLSSGTFTGVKSISRQGAVTTGFTKEHRIGVAAQITDHAALYRVVATLLGVNDLDSGVALKYDGAPTQTAPNALATVQFVLDTANGGAVSFNATTIAGVVGENVTDGDWVYFKESDGKWYKSDADDTAKSVNVKIGKVRATTTTGNSVAGGIFVDGQETVATYVAGTTYYLSNTAGALATSAGTNSVVVGVGDEDGDLVLTHNEIISPSQQQFINAFTGMIVMYGNATPPTGFLACDGSAVSRTTYAALYAVIGTSFGVGDGTTTFNVPDLRGRVPVGAGTGTQVATFASRSSDTVTVTGPTNAANNGWQTGQAVLYSAPSGAMTGLTDNTTYYLIRVTALSFKLASTLANAQNGTQISLSSDGTGAQTFTLTLTARSVGGYGGEENHAMSSTELLAHVHTHNLEASTTGSASDKIPAANGVSGTNTATMSSTGGNAAMNNMQPFGVIQYIIKT